jgi:hypothetical protein
MVAKETVEEKAFALQTTTGADLTVHPGPRLTTTQRESKHSSPTPAIPDVWSRCLCWWMIFTSQLTIASHSVILPGALLSRKPGGVADEVKPSHFLGSRCWASAGLPRPDIAGTLLLVTGKPRRGWTTVWLR